MPELRQPSSRPRGRRFPRPGGGRAPHRRAAGAIAAVCLAALALAVTASGAGAAPRITERLATIAAPGPGPAELDRVYVNRIGPKRPHRILVLIPGTLGGAGDFTLIGRALARRVPGLAVWALDRRSQALEDTEGFERLERGEASLAETFDYYLGWLVNGGNPPDHFRFLDQSAHPYAREWGMETTLRATRRVVRRASAGGRREVWLGGHSLGASLAAAYAAWDFNGRPGHRDLDGLVLIDGGLLDSFDSFDLEDAQTAIAELERFGPFLDLLGIGVPEAAGVLAELAAYRARLDPRGSAVDLQGFPLLPDEFDPGIEVTNRAALGYAFDRDTSPPELRLLHINGGHLAEQGSPRDWIDGGVTPIARLARTFAQEPANGVEWYFPRRLTIDVNGANEMRVNDVARFLGLRLRHTRRIDLPIYAFATDLTEGDVLRGARRLVRRAKTTRREAMIVDGAPRQSHLDPLTAAPRRNRFLRTVVRFLRRDGEPAPRRAVPGRGRRGR